MGAWSLEIDDADLKMDDFIQTINADQLQELCESLETGQTDWSFPIQIAGRITYKRTRSINSIIFMDMQADRNGKFQAIFCKDSYDGLSYRAMEWDSISRLRRFSIVGIVGHAHRTSRPEPSIMVTSIRLLVPCIPDVP